MNVKKLSNWELKHISKALSGLVWLNTYEDNQRLKAVKNELRLRLR